MKVVVYVAWLSENVNASGANISRGNQPQGWTETSCLSGVSKWHKSIPVATTPKSKVDAVAEKRNKVDRAEAEANRVPSYSESCSNKDMTGEIGTDDEMSFMAFQGRIVWSGARRTLNRISS